MILDVDGMLNITYLSFFLIQDAEAVAKDDIQRVLGATEEYKHRWNSTWEEQERRLRQNLQICQFNFDLRQVSIIF